MSYENTIKICLIVTAILIVGILLIKRFVYFRPSSDFIPFKETYQDLSEGTIHGWFIKGTNNKVILFCHGNGGNISHRQEHIDSLNKLGYSVTIFDYSGYGRSTGIPSESQFYQDASKYTDILLQQYDKKDIILYGESIGAAVAAYIVRKYQIPTIIIDSGLPSVKKYIQYKWKFLGILGFLFPEFNTETYLLGYKGNTLIMHSIHDEIIPYESTEFLRSFATSTIDIKGSHNNRIIPWDQVNSFIQNSDK